MSEQHFNDNPTEHSYMGHSCIQLFIFQIIVNLITKTYNLIVTYYTYKNNSFTAIRNFVYVNIQCVIGKLSPTSLFSAYFFEDGLVFFRLDCLQFWVNEKAKRACSFPTCNSACGLAYPYLLSIYRE